MEMFGFRNVLRRRSSSSRGGAWCTTWFFYWLAVFTLPTYVFNVILPSFSWDPRNECFSSATSSGVQMSVDQESQLYILCPSVAITDHVQNIVTDQQLMYENMYLVTKGEYDSCTLDPPRGDGRTRLVMRCENPLDTQRLTYQSFSFQQFQSGEFGYAFEVGKTYYFIATSNGTKIGLNNRDGGRCRSNNMKLSINICAQGNGCHLQNKRCSKSTKNIESKSTNVVGSLEQQPTATTKPTPKQTPSLTTSSPCGIINNNDNSNNNNNNHVNNHNREGSPNVIIGAQVSESTQGSDSPVTPTTVIFVAVGSFLGGVVLALLVAIVYKKTCQVKSLGDDSRNLKNRESSMTEHTHVDVGVELIEDQITGEKDPTHHHQHQPQYSTIQRAEMRKDKEALEQLNQKFFNSTIDYRNSNEFKQEFRRLISSTNSNTGSVRYSDSERYCVTPVGGYCA